MQPVPATGRSGAKIPKHKAHQPQRRRRILDDLICLLAVVLAVLLVRQFVAEPIRVKGRSMCSTLQNGDMMLVTKWDYLIGNPRRQDVIICHYPGRYLDRWKILPQYFVKRLIGLPGDTVEIREGEVFINGQALEEPYLDPAHTRRKPNMEPVTLGEDEYFVLGDNRDNSNDSRRIGPIGRKALVGRVRLVFFPFPSARMIR